jgi:hypothetical protein
MISVSSQPTPGGWACLVMVTANGHSRTHRVFVSESDLQRWGRGEEVARLVQRSFQFLLAREPLTAILPRFRLEDVERYFPEYPALISKPDAESPQP